MYIYYILYMVQTGKGVTASNDRRFLKLSCTWSVMLLR